MLADGPRTEWSMHIGVAAAAVHADSTWHQTPACSPVAVCSDRTCPSIVMRQLIFGPATCAVISAVGVGKTVVSVCVQGNIVRSPAIGLGLTYQHLALPP